jgi:xylono-1,5-lactonase
MKWDLLRDGFGRLEAPCFDLAGRLCFTDRTPPGRILRIEADGSTTQLAERGHVGGLVPHAAGGLVASGHAVSLISEDEPERVLLEHGTGWGFNDLGTDSAGRVFVGRFDTDPMPPASGQGGSLWRIDNGGDVAQYYDGIKLTNGIGVSPEGAWLYHNDTGALTVWASELADEGVPVSRRPLYQFQGERPDGLAIDESGCVWIALMGSGRLARLTPQGTLDQVVEAPSTWTASLCFDGRDLYAVTFGAPYDPHRTGAIYRATADVAGAVVHPAQI